MSDNSRFSSTALQLTRLLSTDFDTYCDHRTARAKLLELAECIQKIKSDLLYCPLSDFLDDCSDNSKYVFLEALAQLEVAQRKFQQAATMITHKE